MDGRANDAVTKALAEAFGVRTSAVTIRTGHTGRTKQVMIEGDSGLLTDRLENLLAR